MAKKGDYINNIYQGSYSSLNPNYGDVFTGYHVSAGDLSLTTDPRTANILKEASEKLSTGVKQIELSMISPEIFESVPKQHLKEVNRLSKLTGINVSVHAPLVEPSGISKEGFSESNRKNVERQMINAVEKSHEINPKGNVPVTFHSSTLPKSVIEKNGKPEEFFVVNAQEGTIHRMPIIKRRFPGEKKEIDIKKELDNLNEEQWNKILVTLSDHIEKGKEAVREFQHLAKTAEAERKAGREVTPEERRAKTYFEFGENFLNESYRGIKDLFEIAYNYCSNTDKKILNEFAKKIESKVEQIEKTDNVHKKIKIKEEIIDEGINTFKKIPPPKVFQPLDEFAEKRAVETFANVAFNSFKKFKEKTPIISIENPPAGSAFSTSEELNKIVNEARNKIIERLINEEKMDKKKAEEAAKKIIGVTWDVGHINMLRRYGYNEEDIIKETEKIAPLVKHIHLSDNFGFEHTELPMGMGNVPIKEMLEKLPKKDIKKVIEAASWWQHFKTPPVKETLEALGSPLYPMFMSPYWNQMPGLQGYFSGYGQMLPQINYETFGAGFSNLPTELGGQRPGAQGSRMSGKPME